MDMLGIGSAISGVLGFMGQRSANKSNESMANNQMEFQERMSGTAYQRAMKDMETAGLNPMLAASAGGASTPMGAKAEAGNALGAGSSSALQALAAGSALKLNNAEIEKKQAEKIAVDASIPGLAARSRMDNASALATEYQVKHMFPWLAQEHEGRAGITQNDLRKSDVDLSGGDSWDDKTNTLTHDDKNTWYGRERKAKLGSAEWGEKSAKQDFQQRGQSFIQDLRRAKAEATLKEYDIPGARNQADYENNVWGGKYERYLPDLGGIASSALGAFAGSRLGNVRPSVPDRPWYGSGEARKGPVHPSVNKRGKRNN